MVSWRSDRLGDLELGADAVGRGDQHRIAEARGLEVEQAAEAAEPADHARPIGRFGRGLDRLDERVAGIDVDARFLVPARADGIPVALGL